MTTTTTNTTPQRRPLYWPISVENQIHKLRKGDRVSVVWIDASESYNVPVKKSVHNHSVESVCTSEGSFLHLQRGKAFDDYHVLLIKDRIDEQKVRLQSIPLVLVKSILVFRDRSKKQLIRVNRRKFTLHFKDGSVKRIGAL